MSENLTVNNDNSEEQSEDEIKKAEDILFLQSLLPKDDNERKRAVNTLHRTYLQDKGKR